MSTMTDSFVLAWGLIAQADPELVKITALSLRVSATACLIGAVIGLLLGSWLAIARFPGHGILVWVMNTLLALPAVVVGLLVYLLLSRSGPLGDWGILFTPTAMVIAQSVLVTPLIAALSRRLIITALEEGGHQLQSLGAKPLTVALLMLLHDRMGVATVLLTAFARAIAEVGAVMIVGGNIAGVTRVMTTTIALETSKGDLALALALGLVLLTVVGVINGVTSIMHRVVRHRTHARVPSSALPISALPNDSTPKPAATEPILTLENVTVRFGRVTALRDATFELQRGECLVLVGSNGSGKTTLLRAMLGLTPFEGRKQYHPLGPDQHMPRASMVFQRSFMLNLSVWRNVWMALWLAGVPASQRKERCLLALSRTGLLPLASQAATTLSGGQQQRLGLARAWALQPDVLYLDEPTASLDPGANNEFEMLIKDVSASGVTVVMSTHNLGQAKRLASRVAYLQAGKIMVIRPANPFFERQDLPQEAIQFLRGELGW